MGGLRNRGVEKKKLKPFLRQSIPPQKFALRLWGNWGPQRPKQKKNASDWQAKIKAAKTLNHEPACNAGGTQSSPKAMSAGELKENKKPLF